MYNKKTQYEWTHIYNWYAFKAYICIKKVTIKQKHLKECNNVKRNALDRSFYDFFQLEYCPHTDTKVKLTLFPL